MTLCYPPGADWSCAYTAEQLDEMRGDPATLAAMERSEAYAWLSLARLTGGQIGVCPETIRPCAAGCSTPGTWVVAPVTGAEYSALPLRTIGSSFTPHIGPSGAWVNSCGCRNSDSCDCTSLPEVILPGPVGRVEEVSVGGAVLDPEAYHVENGDRLVRTDGGTWPMCPEGGESDGPPTWAPVSFQTSIFSWSVGSGGLLTTTFSRDGDVVTIVIDGEITQRAGDASLHVNLMPGIGLPPQFTPSAAHVEWSLDDDFIARLDIYSSGGVSLDDDSDAPPFVLGVGPVHIERSYIGAATVVPPEPPTTGPFEVTYYRGFAPNPAILWAVGRLATEFYKACTGSGECMLPAGTIAVARQGITVEIDAGLFPGGRTNIPEADALIQFYNPYGLRSAPAIASPDTRRPRMKTAI